MVISLSLSALTDLSSLLSGGPSSTSGGSVAAIGGPALSCRALEGAVVSYSSFCMHQWQTIFFIFKWEGRLI